MFLARRIFSTNINKINSKIIRVTPKCFKSTSTKDVEEYDEPIKYSQSPANAWRAEYSLSGTKDTRLWYEPYVIMVSITVFLVYFCIFREENDIDEELSRNLFGRIEGLERKQLEILLDYNKRHSLETEGIINRLKELDIEESISAK